MLHPDGTPNVVEFNCRLGDPETQVVLPLVRSGLLRSPRSRPRAASRCRDRHVRGGAAVTTILAAAGYPDAPVKGAVDHDARESRPRRDGVSRGHQASRGRSAGGQRRPGARRHRRGAQLRCGPGGAAGRRPKRIAFEGKQMRQDIGWREAKRTSSREPAAQPSVRYRRHGISTS